jgi:two-component system, OmpR family, response regulator
MSGKIIAIIDDEPPMVDMLSTFLRLKGYEVRGAYSGQDGLTLIETEQPDLVILDLMLPDIDGYTVCRRVREMKHHAHVPILIISARTDAMSVSRAESSGADAYLTKPVRFPELLAHLDELLG